MTDELREQLADVQHGIWAHWMRYMFSCGQFGPDGTWHMPAFKAERWQRQMDTDYAGLTDKERESDRNQADKVLIVVQPALAAANARAEAAERERDAWQRNASMWHDKADAAEAALARVSDYATYYVVAWDAFEANSDGPEPLEFAEWLRPATNALEARDWQRQNDPRKVQTPDDHWQRKASEDYRAQQQDEIADEHWHL